MNREKMLKRAAEGMGAKLYALLQQGRGALNSELVLNAGSNIGEAIGRLGGAMEGMYRHPGNLSAPRNVLDLLGQGGAALQRAVINEGRGAQGAAIGRAAAPYVAGGAAALGTAALLKRLLSNSGRPQQPIYQERDDYPNYY